MSEEKQRRGGNRGGGSTIHRLELQSGAAARELRRRITGDYASRYTKAQANQAVTELLEMLAANRLLYLTDDMRAALPWLQEARAQCFSEEAQRGLDQLIAAILVVEAINV